MGCPWGFVDRDVWVVFLSTDVRLILLSLAWIVTGGLFAVYGALLVWKPDAFLRFHDTFIDRSTLNRTAAWRKNIRNRDYKALGLLFFAMGLYVIIGGFIKLLTSQH